MAGWLCTVLAAPARHAAFSADGGCPAQARPASARPTCRASTALLSPTQAVVRRRPCSMLTTAVLPLYCTLMPDPAPFMAASTDWKAEESAAGVSRGAALLLPLPLRLVTLPLLLVVPVVLAAAAAAVAAAVPRSPSCSASARGSCCLR